MKPLYNSPSVDGGQGLEGVVILLVPREVPGMRAIALSRPHVQIYQNLESEINPLLRILFMLCVRCQPAENPVENGRKDKPPCKNYQTDQKGHHSQGRKESLIMAKIPLGGMFRLY